MRSSGFLKKFRSLKVIAALIVAFKRISKEVKKSQGDRRVDRCAQEDF